MYLLMQVWPIYNSWTSEQEYRNLHQKRRREHPHQSQLSSRGAPGQSFTNAETHNISAIRSAYSNQLVASFASKSSSNTNLQSNMDDPSEIFIEEPEEFSFSPGQMNTSSSPCGSSGRLAESLQYLGYDWPPESGGRGGGGRFTTPGQSGPCSAVPYNDRPYPCQYCPYRATLKGNLVMHLRTHTGEKPFKCPACDYSTAFQQNLQRHVKRAHCDTPKL